ncbi:hypothetical protein MLD38_014690 [Melastoma candidum]|uniref:Uncharacterized protein n=1 Tax=Melastoma candidum TaxID=119954 RepID=A0ACB9RFG1_9MYRT|nr:hypothetical protein MLD38_014690 [Melastoma candidum]
MMVLDYDADPNGPMYYNGVYHLFYQYNPAGALFDDGMVWAHAVSYDLVDWVQLKNALEPSEPFDIKSCWSGSVTVIDGNVPVIFYTGIDANNTQVQNLASPRNISDPFLEDWVKFSGNPVISLPEGVQPNKFRDPTTAWLGSDGVWRVIVGSWKDGQGTAILYHSTDFINWHQYDHPLYASAKTGMWECPDFFPVLTNATIGADTSMQGPNTKHVMKTSFNSHDYYILGRYDSKTERFLPDAGFTGTSSDLRLDYGKFYASKSFFDHEKNRRILLSWVNESDSDDASVAKGWSGLQSIPREIWLDESGKQLIQRPIEEIKKLRSNQMRIDPLMLEKGSIVEVSGVTASQVDVEVAFELPNLDKAELMYHEWDDPQLMCSNTDASVSGEYGPFGLLALAAEGFAELTAVFFRVFQSEKGHVVLMCSDQSRSSLRNDVDKTTYGAFINIDPRFERISLRTLIDHSILESFGGEGRASITARAYPQSATDNAARLYLFNNGSLAVKMTGLNAWNMKKVRISNPESSLCA